MHTTLRAVQPHWPHVHIVLIVWCQTLPHMQVMSVWPFKQMILRAQLKQLPTTHAQPPHSASDDRGVSSASSQSSSSVAPSSSSQTAAQPSSAQRATGPLPSNLVHQKLSGGDSPAQSGAESPAECGAPACESHEAQGLQDGQAGPDSSRAAAQSSPGMRSETAGAPGRYRKHLQTDYLFHFGDTTEIRKALEMPNRLTGYAMLCWKCLG